jgi:hypothetical protein
MSGAITRAGSRQALLDEGKGELLEVTPGGIGDVAQRPLPGVNSVLTVISRRTGVPGKPTSAPYGSGDEESGTPVATSMAGARRPRR